MSTPETITNWRPVGTLSVIAGAVSCIVLIGPIAPLFISPLGIFCGIVAIRTGHKKLGWTGITLSILGILMFASLLALVTWAIHQPGD